MNKKYVNNLFEKTQSILAEGIAEDTAKLLGIEQTGDAARLIKLLPFAKYLELSNAVDIADYEAAKKIMDDARELFSSKSGVEQPVEEGEVVQMDKYRKELPSKKEFVTRLKNSVLPTGTKVLLAPGTVRGVAGKVAGKIVGVADDGGTPVMYQIQTAAQRNPVLAVRDEFEVSGEVKEADNPSQGIVPPSAQLPSQTMLPGQGLNSQKNAVGLGHKKVNDLQPGDEVEVVDIDGKPAATTVKNPKGPGDTMVVLDKKYKREHIVKKTDVSGTPIAGTSKITKQTTEAKKLAVHDPWMPDTEIPRKFYGADGKLRKYTKAFKDWIASEQEKVMKKEEINESDQALNRMRTLAGIPTIAVVRESESGPYDGPMYDHKDQWLADAKKKGYMVEPSGDGKLVAHSDGIEKGYWDPKYGGFGMGIFFAGAEGKSDLVKQIGQEQGVPVTDLPLSNTDDLEEGYYDWQNKTMRRSMKSGFFKSKAIGTTVKVMAGEDAGKVGVITGAYREPTFSQMVPYVIEYTIQLPDGKDIYTRRENVRKVKTVAAPVQTNEDGGGAGGGGSGGAGGGTGGATCGATGAGSIAVAPFAVGGIVSRTGTVKKKKKDYGIGGSIYKETKKPVPKVRKAKEEAGDGIGRGKKA